MKRKKGFTFIEILVVATLIGILATIGIVTYSSANARARDGKRKSDVEQIRSALEMYRADNGNYPTTLSSLTTDYINELPQTPETGDCSAGNNSYEDCYNRTSQTTYEISIGLETETTDYVKQNP